MNKKIDVIVSEEESFIIIHLLSPDNKVPELKAIFYTKNKKKERNDSKF